MTQLTPAMRRSPAFWVASGFGCGLAPKAPGTVATLVAVIPWLLFQHLPLPIYLAIVLATFAVGVWTAHMFLMFQLERPDVLAVGDLGVRRAAERAYDLRELPTPSELETLADPWRPWRTVACRHLWHSLDNAPA